MDQSSLAGAPTPERMGRALASPLGVLVLVPLLVIASGVTILLLGRSATREASDSMARRQLAAQATDVEHDVAFALDQADPMFTSLRALADPQLPIDRVASQLRDLVVGRPGVANVSIGFPNGTLRGTFLDVTTGELRVQESLVATGTLRTNYSFKDGFHVIGSETTDYDPRKRPHWDLATRAKQRVWMPPRVFFTSHKTGLTVAEPIYAGDQLIAVTTVDFDVTEMSAFVVRAPFEGARTIRSHAEQPVPPLRPLVRDWLPEGLEQLVLSLLAKDPRDRPKDARVLIKALRAIEIPTEHAWPEARAQAWWWTHKPLDKKTKPGSPEISKTIVPKLDLTDDQKTRDGKLHAGR